MTSGRGIDQVLLGNRSALTVGLGTHGQRRAHSSATAERDSAQKAVPPGEIVRGWAQPGKSNSSAEGSSVRTTVMRDDGGGTHEILFADFPQDARTALLRSGLESFSRRGFESTTTRDIAAGAGLSPAALYVHYPSKASLLLDLSRAGHKAAENVLIEALEGIDPSEGLMPRIASAMGEFAAWHAEHRVIARVVQLELRSLEGEAYAEVSTIRRRTQGRLVEEIQAAVDAGEADIAEVRAVARALMSLCIDICRWYRPGGVETPGHIREIYSTLTCRILAGSPDCPAV